MLFTQQIQKVFFFIKCSFNTLEQHHHRYFLSLSQLYQFTCISFCNIIIMEMVNWWKQKFNNCDSTVIRVVRNIVSSTKDISHFTALFEQIFGYIFGHKRIAQVMCYPALSNELNETKKKKNRNRNRNIVYYIILFDLVHINPKTEIKTCAWVSVSIPILNMRVIHGILLNTVKWMICFFLWRNEQK